jgi:hypothetical protein
MMQGVQTLQVPIHNHTPLLKQSCEAFHFLLNTGINAPVCDPHHKLSSLLVPQRAPSGTVFSRQQLCNLNQEWEVLPC